MGSRSAEKIGKYLSDFGIFQTISRSRLNCGRISSDVYADDKKEK